MAVRATARPCEEAFIPYSNVWLTFVLKPLVSRQGRVSKLALVGSHVLSASSDRTIRVWSTAPTPSCIRTLDQHHISYAAPSPSLALRLPPLPLPPSGLGSPRQHQRRDSPAETHRGSALAAIPSRRAGTAGCGGCSHGSLGYSRGTPNRGTHAQVHLGADAGRRVAAVPRVVVRRRQDDAALVVAFPTCRCAAWARSHLSLARPGPFPLNKASVLWGGSVAA